MTHVSAAPGAPDHAQPEQFDPYALPPGAIQEPPRRLAQILGQIGPGLILAGAIVGTGELIQTTHLGAKAGFVLLWLVLLSCFVKVFVQVELGRYAIASGRPTMTAFREIGGVGNFIGLCWVLMMLMTQLQLGAMVGGVGQALHLAMPGVSPALGRLFGEGAAGYLALRPEVPWAALAAVVTCVLLAAGSYKLVETGSTIMVVLFTFGTMLCVALLPWAGHPIPWGRVVGGFSFSLPREAIPAAIAMFGITGVGAAELIAYPYWCIEKGYARRAGPADASEGWLERARGWIRVMQVDAWVSMVVYSLATLAFFFLGATVLYGRGGLPGNVGEMTEALRTMYAPVMGPFGSKWFIVIGVIAVLYSTLYAATAANARALTDFLRVNGAVRLRDPGDRTKWVRRFCVAFPLIDLATYLLFRNPVLMVTIGGFVQALMLPMVGGAALFLRYRRTDRRLTAGVAWDIFLWTSVAALTATAAIGLNDTRKKLAAWSSPPPAKPPATAPTAEEAPTTRSAAPETAPAPAPSVATGAARR
jgi:Mn2+/Fe2+ NRAMP family transporter